MNDDDFKRLEDKVDKLTDAIGKLILFEERQVMQGQRLGAMEIKVSVHDAALQKVDRKVDQWVNRGIGLWAAAAVLFSFLQYVKK